MPPALMRTFDSLLLIHVPCICRAAIITIIIKINAISSYESTVITKYKTNANPKRSNAIPPPHYGDSGQ